jgi:ring-1,2-phenylacetyl-CoA epoxidase subunit PaaC
MNSLETAKFEYCLNLADSALILSQRLGEYCGHGPVLEEDIALTNISLDLLGQARNFLSLAGEIEGKGRTEDSLAYFRDSKDFRNLLITELPNNDYAYTMARQFFYDMFRYLQFEKLMKSADENMAGLAAKSFKEITYHLRHSAYWMRCFGEGTEESQRRVQNAVDSLWMYTGDFFESNDQIRLLHENGIVPDPKALEVEWLQKVEELFAISSLRMPEKQFMQKGSRNGMHTEYLGHLLTEMQSIQRAYPGLEW